MGVRGLVRIGAYTEKPEDLVAYGPLHAGPGGAVVPLTIVRVDAGVPIGRVTGIDDRTAAEALRGTILCVPRRALPAAPAETFYHHDLIGLAARTADGASLGRVAAVHDHGAGAVLEIAGEDGTTRFVAFTREFVPVIDLKAGHLVVDPAALDEGEGP